MESVLNIGCSMEKADQGIQLKDQKGSGLLVPMDYIGTGIQKEREREETPEAGAIHWKPEEIFFVERKNNHKSDKIVLDAVEIIWRPPILFLGVLNVWNVADLVI